MKSKIDNKMFTMEGSPGVISIKNPDWNMTGEYTCAVQTFESTDKRSARLQIIGGCHDHSEKKKDRRWKMCGGGGYGMGGLKVLGGGSAGLPAHLPSPILTWSLVFA